MESRRNKNVDMYLKRKESKQHTNKPDAQGINISDLIKLKAELLALGID